MKAIEIARKLAGYAQEASACQAYTVAVQEGCMPEEELEAALYILRASSGDYKVSFTCLRNLYNRGCFQAECLEIMTQAFYQPNEKLLRSRYEKNCRLLERYPYLFRKDFVPFEELPVRFYPYDEKGVVPFFVDEARFGDYMNFEHPVVSRNFFRDLEKPILADDVYSQYELEYLCDNVRDSAYVGRENHIYLHYTSWADFCAQLTCLNLRAPLLTQKLVFLIGDEISQYPIDFKERFGLDYSKAEPRPVGIREVHKLIWHTQLSTHNGGDFFNEVFDDHPNLLAYTSVMFDSIQESIKTWRAALEKAKGSKETLQDLMRQREISPRVAQELLSLRDVTDKDVMVAFFLGNPHIAKSLDPAARIAPALFFQPHFSNIVYKLHVDANGNTVLDSDQYMAACKSPIFRGFKYIKTFTPMRRLTTSHAATVRFMYEATKGPRKEGESLKVVADAVSQRVLNRSFMIDWQDRLYQDSVLVRFEDGKLNPKATFTALAAFLDVPYTESMSYCSELGVRRTGETEEGGYAIGFDPVTVYRTYDEYASDSERCYIEYFMRDVYEYYGYGFQYYDGKEVDMERVKEWVGDFSRIDHYMRETWAEVYQASNISANGQPLGEEFLDAARSQLLDKRMEAYRANRVKNGEILMRSLRFVNRNGQELHMMPKLELDPALLEHPLYHG